MVSILLTLLLLLLLLLLLTLFFVFRVVSAVMLIMHELLENSISHHLCSFFMFSFVLFFCR